MIWRSKLPNANLHFRTALLFCLLPGLFYEAQAQVSSSQARRLIARMAGFELPNNSVSVSRVTGDRSSAVVTAAIETAFRLEKDEAGDWRVREFRTGPDRWESIELISRALSLGFQPTSKCDFPDLTARDSGNELSARRIRCVMAALVRIDLPSDAIRVRSISSFNAPLASKPSVLAEVVVETHFRFVRARSGWSISAVRTGNRDWIDLPLLMAAVDNLKRERALAELTDIADALEEFRSENGFYVVAADHGVLIDHLSPSYLPTVIRLDPWHRPYEYQGSQGQFVLRSVGADGRENTADDIVLSRGISSGKSS